MTPGRQGCVEAREESKRRILNRYDKYLIRELLDQWMRSQARDPNDLRTLVRFPEDNDVRVFRPVRHFIRRVEIGLEHLIPHGNGPIASLPAPNLLFVFRLRKKRLQAHLSGPVVSDHYEGEVESL